MLALAKPLIQTHFMQDIYILATLNKANAVSLKKMKAWKWGKLLLTPPIHVDLDVVKE